MTNPSRAKGDRYERKTVALLESHGVDSRRVPQSGSAVAYPGDVEIMMPGGSFIAEVKARKKAERFTWVRSLIEELVGKILAARVHAKACLVLYWNNGGPLFVLWGADAARLFADAAKWRALQALKEEHGTGKP